MKETVLISYLFLLGKKSKSGIIQVGDVKILKLGDFSVNYGPDFQNSAILYKNRNLHGDIEVHGDADCWVKHRHFKDRKYNKVILHIAGKLGKYKTKTEAGSKIPTIILKKDSVLGILKKSDELRLHADDFFQLLPCWTYMRKNSSAGLRLHKIFQKFGILRFRQKAYFIQKRIKDYEIRRFFYFLLLLFLGGRKNREIFEIIGRAFLDLHKTHKDIYKIVQKCLKKELPNIIDGRYRPYGRRKKRINFFLQFFYDDKTMAVFSRIQDLFHSDNNNFFSSVRKYLNKEKKWPLFTADMIIINVVYPLLWVSLYDKRRVIFNNYKIIPGLENNHKVRRFVLNYKDDKFTELEMQGMIYIYDHYCSFSCRHCPIVHCSV